MGTLDNITRKEIKIYLTYLTKDTHASEPRQRQAHGEYSQISVYAKEHYIKHRHTQSGEIEKNAYLACNIFAYARARKLLLDKVKQIQKLQRQIQLRKIIIGQIDNLTG